MPLIDMQSPEQRFLATVSDIAGQIATSDEFRKQLDAIISGDSVSIKIGDEIDGSVKKLRFFSHEFVTQMQSIYRRIQTLPEKERSDTSMKKYEDVLQVLIEQIGKQQVVYREKIKNGEVQYFASDEILTKVKNGEFVLKSKSGEKKIVVSGSEEAKGASGKAVKEINITAIGPDIFTQAAKIFTEVVSEAELPEDAMETEEEAVKEAIPPPETAAKVEEMPPASKKPVSKQELEYAPEEATLNDSMTGEEKMAEEEEEEQFHKEEKEKDIKAQQKHKDIEARQELKKEMAVQEVVETETTDEEISDTSPESQEHE